jgi:uncharacterized protein YndB with AHSA1/START domain
MADQRAVAGADTYRIEVRRVIARPVAEVFAAWTTPAIIAEWMAMPGSGQVRVEADVRVGGLFHIDLVHNGAPWRQDGTYLEIEPNRRLKFTWVTPECPAVLGSQVSVDFVARGDTTELVLTHIGFPDQKTRDAHDATGWQQILDLIVAASKTGLTVATLARAAMELRQAMRG